VLQSISKDRLARSGIAGCDRPRLLLTGESRCDYDPPSSGLWIALFLRRGCSSGKLPSLALLLDFQFCAARCPATRHDSRDGEPSATSGCDNATPTRGADGSGHHVLSLTRETGPFSKHSKIEERKKVLFSAPAEDGQSHVANTYARLGLSRESSLMGMAVERENWTVGLKSAPKARTA